MDSARIKVELSKSGYQATFEKFVVLCKKMAWFLTIQ